jgi:arsenate reductase-like glutaredoxin family protein
MNAGPILYIRRGCPWCRQAAAFFSTHGVTIEIRDVSKRYSDMKRLIEVSDQGNVPCDSVWAITTTNNERQGASGLRRRVQPVG